MTTSTLDRIEAAIDELTLAEQLWLIERLARRIRSGTVLTPDVDDAELAAMANDPAIQRELRQIDAEFSVAEAEGLASSSGYPCHEAWQEGDGANVDAGTSRRATGPDRVRGRHADLIFAGRGLSDLEQGRPHEALEPLLGLFEGPHVILPRASPVART
jgi:hypothetical protein